MNKYIFFIIFILLPAEIFSQYLSDSGSTGELLRKASGQFEEMNEKEALETYMEVLEKDPENYKALWNASLLHSTIGHRLENENQKEEFYEKAAVMAEKAVELYPDKVHPYYVLSVAKGRMADLVGARSRIQLSHVIEENIKKALEMDSSHAPSWHLYGVWQSEVANLSRGERFAARFISGGLPRASNEEAEECLKKAMELNPQSIIIHYDLAHHYLRSGQDERAIPVLEKLLTLEPTIKDNERHIKIAKKLLGELRTQL